MFSRLERTAFITFLTMALAGCFGGSSSGGGDEDQGGSNGGDLDSGVVTTLDSLANGLDNDANQQGLLFYFGNDLGQGNLRAIAPDHPTTPSTYETGGLGFGSTRVQSVLSGNWVVDDMDLTDIQVEKVVYTLEQEGDGKAKLLEADNTMPPVSAQQIGDGKDFGALGGITELVQNPENHVESQLLLPGRTNQDDFFLLSVGDDDTTSPNAVEVSPDHLGHQLTAIRGIDTLTLAGWLKADDTLRLLDEDGEDLGEIQQPTETLSEATEVRKIGEIMPDGSYYLEIKFNQGLDREDRLFVLEPEETADSGEAPWSVHPVSFQGDTDFDTRAGSENIGDNDTNPERIAYGNDDDLFFVNNFVGVDNEDSAVYRLQGRTLEIVAETDDTLLFQEQLFRGPDALVWFTDRGKLIRTIPLDDRDNITTLANTQLDSSDFGDVFSILSDYSTPIRSHRDGWIFYNVIHLSAGQENTGAIARQLDGDGYFAIENAEWVGASHDGSLGEGSFLGDGQLSEVFLMSQDQNDNRQLAAVDARDPENGMVNLGQLPAGTESVNEFGQAGGPHRLFQVELDTDNEQVVFVNTREADSLEEVEQAGDDTRPVDGF